MFRPRTKDSPQQTSRVQRSQGFYNLHLVLVSHLAYKIVVRIWPFRLPGEPRATLLSPSISMASEPEPVQLRQCARLWSLRCQKIHEGLYIYACVCAKTKQEVECENKTKKRMQSQEGAQNLTEWT
jgi:hypothetical protein